jgi:secreted PhoX family phosphatase
MSASVSRRGFLGGSGVALGVALVGANPFVGQAAAASTRSARGYGPLVPRAGEVVALPEGFSYTVLGEVGTTSGGLTTPSDPDAMGCFARPGGGSVLVSNHEVGGTEEHPVPLVDGLVYDPAAGGGTTTWVLDAGNAVDSHYVSVAGTHNNCAGGVTPWGTWLTCEETEARAGSQGSYGRLTKDHGFVFEVDPTSQAANADRSPVPLRFLGRYAHEACAVDPRTGQVYLTEDASNPNGLLFRWTPPTGWTGGRGALHSLASDDTAGTLEALVAHDEDGRIVPDLSLATDVGTVYSVRWTPVPDRLASTTSVRKQFADGQVTRSRNLEGMWWGDGAPHFVASFARHGDGSANEHDGQVWRLDPKRQQIRLTTLFGVNADPDTEGTNFDGPDNITVSPYGGVILAEDGEGRSHLVGVTEQGKAYPIALNTTGDSEWCGPVFSADGRTLFANIQGGPGYTLAITGPWGRPSNAAV